MGLFALSASRSLLALKFLNGKVCLGAVVLECLCAGGQHLPSAWRGLGAAPGQGGSWALLVMPEGTGWEFLS